MSKVELSVEISKHHSWGERFSKTIVFVAFIAGVVWTAICGSLAVAGFCFSERLGHSVHRTWGRGLLRLTGIDLDITGRENIPRTGGFILAPNHSSWFDIPIVAALDINFKWVSKEEVRKIPFVGWAMAKMGCYFITRSSSSKDLSVLKRAENGLGSGTRILIFPEGTRTRTGALLPMKKGAFRTAQNAGVPLIPVAIRGSYSIAPGGSLLPAHRGHQIEVRFGTPFEVPEGDIAPSIEKFAKYMRQLLSNGAT